MINKAIDTNRQPKFILRQLSKQTYIEFPAEQKSSVTAKGEPIPSADSALPACHAIRTERQAAHLNKLTFLMLALLCCLAGCRTSRKAESTKTPALSRHLSSKAVLTVPSKGAVFTVNGTMKLISGERMQLSFLMPILRTEVARMEVTPEEVLLVDRMGKRYVRITRRELQGILSKKAEFARLEQLLFNASKPGGKRELTGKELGVPALEKGKIELYDFSNAPFTLVPTELTSRYRQVELEELLQMLMSL